VIGVNGVGQDHATAFTRSPTHRLGHRELDRADQNLQRRPIDCSGAKTDPIGKPASGACLTLATASQEKTQKSKGYMADSGINIREVVARTSVRQHVRSVGLARVSFHVWMATYSLFHTHRGLPPPYAGTQRALSGRATLACYHLPNQSQCISAEPYHVVSAADKSASNSPRDPGYFVGFRI
jgi:hypothetical protein